MSLRVNKAKKFNGKAYIASDELDSLLQAMSLTGNTLTLVGANKTVEGDAITAKGIDFSALTSIANKSVSLAGTATDLITVSSNAFDATGLTAFIGDTSANKIVTTDANGKLSYGNAKVTSIDVDVTSASDTNIPTEKAVRSAINAVAAAAISITGASGITVEGEGTTKTIKSNLRIAKVATTEGYAASYQLQFLSDATNGTYTAVDSTKIDIVKDQFLKSGSLVYGTSAALVDGAVEGESNTKTSTAIYPFVKLVLFTNTNGSNSDEQSATSTIYIPVNELFHDKTAGNGIDATALASNEIKVVADATDKIYTSKGVQASVMSVGASGVKASGIQNAIDLAVEDEHAKASAAIAGINSDVEAFESSVNTAISSVVTNVNTALDSTISNVNAKVDSAVSAVNANVSAVVGAIQSDVSDVVANVNTAISSAVGNVNTQVSAAVTKAVELEEVEYTLSGTLTEGVTVADGVVTISGVTGNVLAVFDNTGAQVYPEVVKTSAGTAATNVLTADYGSATVAPKWTVLHTKAIAYTNASAASATTVASATYSNATYSSASKESVASASAAAYDDSNNAIGELEYKTANE